MTKRDLPQDHGSGPPGSRTVKTVLKKQGVCSIDNYVDGRRKCEGIDPDGRPTETVLGVCKAEITECRQLKKDDGRRSRS